MGPVLNLLIFPRQRLKRVQPEVDALSDAVMRLYDMDVSETLWTEQREGAFARLTGGASPDMLARIPSAKAECTALLVCRREEGGWGYRLCWKGTVEDAFESWTEGPVTLEQHAARMVRRFPKLDREALLACLAQETPEEDVLERFLAAAVPWACGLAASKQLVSVSAVSVPDRSSPQENAPDRSEGQRPPEREPGLEVCLPFLTGVRALRRPPVFPLSLFQKRAAEEIPHQGWTVQELEEVLDRFYSGQLAWLELDFSLQGEGTFVRRLGKTVYQPVRATLELIREKKRCMCLFLDDQDSYLYRLIADRTPYMEEESDQLEQTAFLGQTVDRYTVFQEPRPAAIPREVSFLLSRLDRRDSALSPTLRMGVWSGEGTITNTAADRQRHQEVREIWRLN